jgi:hypothetical protein
LDDLTSKNGGKEKIVFMNTARWITDMSACGVFLGDSKLAATRTVLIGG